LVKSIDQINVKLVLLGDGGVGKTSLISHFLKKSIPKKYIPTIGSIISKQEYKLKNRLLKVNIWDIGGQRSFNPLNPSFYTNVDAAYLVFDLTKPKETLAEIKNVYLTNLEKYAKECKTLVIGNKLDLITNNKDLKKFKNLLPEEVPLMIVSAQTGENVIETFELLIYTFLQDYEKKFGNENYLGTAENFIESLGKSETDLISRIINFKDISSIKIQQPSETEFASEIIDENISMEIETPSEKKLPDISKYIPMEKEIKKMNVLTDEVIVSFNKDLEKIEELLLNLKKVPIDSLIESIDKTKEQLDGIKENFNFNLKAFMNLEKKNKAKEK
jgi:small GTP-binding protein